MDLFLQALSATGELNSAATSNPNQPPNQQQQPPSNQQQNQQNNQQNAMAALDFSAILGISNASTSTPSNQIQQQQQQGQQQQTKDEDMSWLLGPSDQKPLQPQQNQIQPQLQQQQQQLNLNADALAKRNAIMMQIQARQQAAAQAQQAQQQAQHLTQQQQQFQQNQQQQQQQPQNPLFQPNLAAAAAAKLQQQQQQQQLLLQQQRLQQQHAQAAPVIQDKFNAILAKVPKDKLPLAEGLIARLKNKQINIQQFAEAVKTLMVVPPPQGGPSPLPIQPATPGAAMQFQQPPPIQLHVHQQPPPIQLQGPPQQQQQQQQNLSQDDKKGKKKKEGDDSNSKFDIGKEFDVTMGIDVRREEEDLLATSSLPSHLRNRHVPANPTGQDRSRLQSLVDMNYLRNLVDTIANKSQPGDAPLKITPQSLEYMSHALTQRLTTFLTKTIRTAKHRAGIHQHEFLLAHTAPASPVPGDTKKYVDVKLGLDPKAVLVGLEKLERAVEAKERSLVHPDGRGRSANEMRGDGVDMSTLDEGGDEGGSGKKRKKKDGAGGGKKDVSETVKVKSTNSTALKAVGGKKGMKAWMTEGGAASASAAGEDGGPKKRARKTKGEDEGGMGNMDYSDLKDVGSFESDGKKITLARTMNVKEMCRVTLKDCVHVLEQETHMRTSALMQKWSSRVS